MRAQVLESFNAPYTFKERREPPAPEGKDLKIEVLGCSFCYTDDVFKSGAMWQDLPRVGSHEFAGKILAMGPDVEASLGLEIGTMVGVPGRAYHPCGNCYECRNNDKDPEGYGVWCTRAGNLGLSRDGGFQDVCIVDSRQVAPMPKELKAIETAPLCCAGLTSWSAIERAGIHMEKTAENKNKTVAISGAGGGLGHLGIQFAARLGCRVIAIDTGNGPLDLVRKVVSDLGEDGERITIVDARKQTAETVRLEVCGEPEEGLSGEKGCDAAIILPESQEALDYAVKLLKDHSTCVCVSFPKDGFRIQPRDLVFRHIDMVGVLVGRNAQLRAMLKFAAANNVRATIKTYPLEKLNDLVEDYHKGAGGKLVIDMKM